jgi:hypothetical protein
LPLILPLILPLPLLLVPAADDDEIFIADGEESPMESIIKE